MFKSGRRLHGWMVIWCWFGLLRNTILFLPVSTVVSNLWFMDRQSFSISLWCGVSCFHRLSKIYLESLHIDQDRYILFIVLHRTSSICTGLSSFTFFEIKQAHGKLYIFLSVQPYFELIEHTFPNNLVLFLISKNANPIKKVFFVEVTPKNSNS